MAFDKKKYDMDYIKKYRSVISVMVSKKEKEKWKALASARGKSLNAFIIECVESAIAENEKVSQ